MNTIREAAEPILTVRRVDGDWLVSRGGQEANFGTSVTISLDAVGMVLCKSPEKVVVKPPAPPQRKPLTDEEIGKIAVNSQDGISPHDDTLRFARAIEQAHGIWSEE
jgi:hypothetical protein